MRHETLEGLDPAGRVSVGPAGPVQTRTWMRRVWGFFMLLLHFATTMGQCKALSIHALIRLGMSQTEGACSFFGHTATQQRFRKVWD